MGGYPQFDLQGMGGYPQFTPQGVSEYTHIRAFSCRVQRSYGKVYKEMRDHQSVTLSYSPKQNIEEEVDEAEQDSKEEKVGKNYLHLLIG